MKKLIIVLFLFLILDSCSLVQPVHAQDSSLSLAIYPPVIEISSNPPTPLESTITIVNQTDQPQNLDIQLKPFEANNDGSIKYITDDKVQAPYKQIFDRIKFIDQDNELKDIELKPYEAKNINISFNLDKDSPRGEYYFSVIFMSTNPSALQNSGSAIPGGIATNILLTVGEKGPSYGQIKDFSSPTFLGSGPVPITLLLKNTSNHFITPTGRVSIYDMFGKEIERLEILPQYILPDSNRYLIDENQASPSAKLTETITKLNSTHPVLIWPEKFLFGIYKLKVVVKTAPTSEALQAETTLISLPLYSIFALSFFIFILAGIWLRVKRKV